MKTNNIKKLVTIALVGMIGITTLTGCAGVSASNKVSESKQEITYNLGTDIKSLDPAIATDATSGEVLVNTFEGLCSLDSNEKAIKGVAESWDISSDKLTYTFKLRKDAKWSNGDSVKASDFEYEWKRLLNPETASEYAYQLLYIKGANEYNSGKGNADNVGVKAVDDNTLVVTLENPTPYFLELTATSPYFPVDEKVVENNKDWSMSADTFVSNGAFKVSNYTMKDSIVLTKNDNYFDKDKIKLNKITMKFVEEETSAWASYKSGQFDIVDTVPKSDVQEALKDGSAKKFDNLATYFLDFNMTNKGNEVLKDARVRKALSLAIDRDSLVTNVTKGGQTPAHGMVSKGISINGKDFTEEKNYFDIKGDIEQAKKLLSDAGYPNGQGFPEITLLYNPEGGQGLTMEALQDMWKKNLGVNIQLQAQEWNTFQDSRNDKQFDIARDGWNADYVDAMTFLDMFKSDSQQNNSGYNNVKFDNVIDSAKKEIDTDKRIDLLHQAEDILMDDMPVIPLYYYTRVIGVKDFIKDYRVSVMGYIYFKDAYVEK